VPIEDTFAEAFSMHMNRTIITAYTEEWARITAQEATGFATSIIMTPAEAGIEYTLTPDQTPDARPGVRVIFATAKKEDLEQQLLARLSQCVLTSPTACAYDDTPDPRETYDIGRRIAMFGDGYQTKKGPIGGRVLWLVPRMSGTFVVQERFGRTKGVAGGNIIIFDRSVEAGMATGQAAVAAIEQVEGAYTPFPGGLVGSGSKIGSRYSALPASTNERYCPTLRTLIADTAIPHDCNFVLEIVINGLSEQAVREAMRSAITTICEHPYRHDVIRVTAGNFGGRLGKYKIWLHELFE